MTSWSCPGMIVVRETYRAYKWQIRAAVSLLQRYGALLVDRGVGQRARILTDASGADVPGSYRDRDRQHVHLGEPAPPGVSPARVPGVVRQLLPVVEAGADEFYRVEYTAG